MRIKIVDYPLTTEFEIDRELPEFEYGCKVRTALAQTHLSMIDYNAPHLPTDFIVEQISKTKTGENWYLGS